MLRCACCGASSKPGSLLPEKKNKLKKHGYRYRVNNISVHLDTTTHIVAQLPPRTAARLYVDHACDLQVSKKRENKKAAWKTCIVEPGFSYRFSPAMQIKLLLWLQFASLIALGVGEGPRSNRLAQTLWAVVESVSTQSCSARYRSTTMFFSPDCRISFLVYGKGTEMNTVVSLPLTLSVIATPHRWTCLKPLLHSFLHIYSSDCYITLHCLHRSYIVTYLKL